MSAETEQRKLAAIMFTDMVGYSALAQRDDKLALELLEEHFSTAGLGSHRAVVGEKIRGQSAGRRSYQQKPRFDLRARLAVDHRYRLVVDNLAPQNCDFVSHRFACHVARGVAL